MISVSDAGIGISDERKDSIFKPYVQEDASIARMHGGSGLGLAICKAIVELMHGSIKLDTTVDKGSTFTVTIPLIETDLVPEKKKSQTSTTEPLPADLKILVVDDNDVNLTVATGFLKKIGYVADTAKDGFSALQAASQNSYDIIFMDCL